MTINFTLQEQVAIKQLAQMSDLSEEAIVVQSLRMYQQWRLGKIRLTWPKIVEHKFYEADISVPEAPVASPEEPPTVDILA